MSDVFSKKKRSEVMSKIKARGNASTELRVTRILRKNNLSGWRRHQKLPGTPDFTFHRVKKTLFIDGCFWHGCPRCRLRPRQNSAFWLEKISANRKRDIRNTRQLRRMGWDVLRIRECSLRREADMVLKIRAYLAAK